MSFQLLYWHWLVLGMLLVVAEIFIPSFTIFWFGLGALVVGLIMLALKLSFTAQILIWTVSSVLFTVLWFQYFKPRMIDKTSAGMSRDAVIGESGQVIKAPTEHSVEKCALLRPCSVMMSGNLSVTRILRLATGCISKRFRVIR